MITLGMVALILASAAPGRAQRRDEASAAEIGAQPMARRSSDPPRIFATATAGLPLRIARNVDLDQSRLGPAFVDATGTFVLSGQGAWRHGLMLGASLNVSEEGGYTEPVGAGEQLVLMPAYAALITLSPSWSLLAHAGLPILAVGPGRSVGAEVAAGIGYRLRAGLGVFSELGANVFVGESSTVHPTVSLEVGFFVDYEVLP